MYKCIKHLLFTRRTGALSLMVDTTAFGILPADIGDLADLLALLAPGGAGNASLVGRAVTVNMALVDLDADSPAALAVARALVDAVGRALGDALAVDAGLVLEAVADA